MSGRTHRRGALTRAPWLLAALLAAVAWGPAAQGQGFAELEVIAYGAQRFDLATGFTELPDGGEAVERRTGVRLSAPWLRYAEGDRLEAHDALVEGDFGRIEAPMLRLDIAARVLSAEASSPDDEDEPAAARRAGLVRLTWDDGAVEAEGLRFDAESGWLWLAGSVRGDVPVLEAAQVGYLSTSGVIVLLPPYRYEDGPLVLRADAAGAPLQLTPDRDGDGVLLGYDASTTLSEEVRSGLEARRDEP